jgi:hypothetical protein
MVAMVKSKVEVVEGLVPRGALEVLPLVPLEQVMVEMVPHHLFQVHQLLTEEAEGVLPAIFQRRLQGKQVALVAAVMVKDGMAVKPAVPVEQTPEVAGAVTLVDHLELPHQQVARVLL